MRKTFGQLTRNSGQATIEYILLLVVVVALILGPLKQFSQMFNGYMEALFGSGQYFACLLETGELGGQSTDAGSSCSATLRASVQAALAKSQAGGSANGSGSGSGANSSNASNSNPNSNSQDGSDSSSADKKTPTTSNAAQGSSTSDSSGSGANGSENNAFNNVGVSAGANQRNRPPSQQIVKGGGAGAGKNGAEDSYVKSDGEQFDYKSLKPKSGFEIPINKLDRRFEEADAEAVRAEKLSPKEVLSTNTKNLRAKEVSLDPPRAPAAKDDDVNTEGFGFSMLLKWFLIAGILIALIVVVGGQALQISKGGDN